ncbi:hypothetical protein M407DRAFT_17144 [Tulasnella calospora MUT 4182]|uniref:BZIP domain-containing protein n=1 Tax=Tulasnella calospora MUT 4182 TaxID=1051891 RepID=A0A0C3LJI6_9AGAM|nr:hypothetical protein M407DRAFT_17144 [Tulasnella calospora MUT 4182]
MTRRLSRSEEDIVVLKKEKKALEDRNEMLSAENRALRAHNKHLHDVNAMLQLPDWQKPTLRGATSSVPYILPDTFQAAGSGYTQAGSGYTQAGSGSLNTPNNYLPSTTTVQSPSDTDYTNPQSSYHQAPSLNPPSSPVYPNPPGRRMNVPVAMSVGSSGSWASQPHAQEANTVTRDGNQFSEPSDARQYAARGPGFVHARGSVGKVWFPVESAVKFDICSIYEEGLGLPVISCLATMEEH